ncbi:MAG: conjugal transfer protein TraA [Telluria sp.]
MASGGSIPVWFSEQDRRKVEEAAALAGYRHLSKYIRDRALGRNEDDGLDPVQVWAERVDLVDRLTAIQRDGQASTMSLLAALLVLVANKSTTRERNELATACATAANPAEVLTAAFPDLATLLLRFSERR